MITGQRIGSLRSIASATGSVCVLALDHRDALTNAFRRAGLAVPDAAQVLDLKCRIAAALAPRATGILLDAEAVPRCRPRELGLLMPLEEQGHEPCEGGRLSRLIEGFGAAEAAALGADGCKLLVYYRADHPATAARQRQLVERAAADCHRHGLALVVEPLVYRLGDEHPDAYRTGFGQLVVAAAEQLAASGADLLKLAFPGDATLCELVSEAAAPLPWTLLGGSEVDGETFAAQLEIACRAGACGFVAGRVVWGGALGLEGARQRDWLAGHAVSLFTRLAEIAHEHGRSIG